MWQSTRAATLTRASTATAARIKSARPGPDSDCVIAALTRCPCASAAAAAACREDAQSGSCDSGAAGGPISAGPAAWSACRRADRSLGCH